MAIATSTIPAPTQGLRRELGLVSTTSAVIGGIIAVGIFLTPAGMAKALGSPMWLLLVWLVIGAMTVSGALCFGELAGRFPSAGGAYVYLKECYGRRIAFLFGWILRWTTWLKLGLLGFLTVWAFAFRLGSWSNFVPFVAQRPGSLPLAPALAVGVVSAFFSFGGWWDVSKLAGEVRDPGRTLPRALLLGLLAVTVVYIVVSAVFLYLVPLDKVTSDQTFVAQAGEVLFGPTGGVVFAAIVIICLVGSLSALIILAPRLYYAMANDGLFLKAVARTHPRFGTPANAIAIQGSIASLLVLLGNFEQIISYAIFIVVFFLGLTVSGLFILRTRQQADESVVLTPGYPATPVVFLLLVATMLILVAVRTPRGALMGVVVVLAGLPVYEILQRRLHQSAR
jgi:basic amino acid/polyamine antiporter, APA family